MHQYYFFQYFWLASERTAKVGELSCVGEKLRKLLKAGCIDYFYHLDHEHNENTRSCLCCENTALLTVKAVEASSLGMSNFLCFSPSRVISPLFAVRSLANKRTGKGQSRRMAQTDCVYLH